MAIEFVPEEEIAVIGAWYRDASFIANDHPTVDIEDAGIRGIHFPTSAFQDSHILSHTTESTHALVITQARNDSVSTEVEVAQTDTLVLVAMFL
jgi:hypothetical protein